MKKFCFFVVLYVLSTGIFSLQAQMTTTLICGDIHSDRFVDGNRNHNYAVDVEANDILVVHTLPIDNRIRLRVEISNASGSLISANRFSPQESPAILETSEIPASGTYDVSVRANTDGAYQIFVSCIENDGNVLTDNNLVQPLACGDQIDNTMIRRDEIHRYYLFLESDTIMDIFLESLYGRFGDMTFEFGLYSPTNQELDRISDRFKDVERTLFEQITVTDGIYRLYVKGFDSVGENYRLSVDCTLPSDDIAISGRENRRVLEPTNLSAPTFDEVRTAVQTTQVEEVDETSEDDSDDEDGATIEIASLESLDAIEMDAEEYQLMGDDSVVSYMFIGQSKDTILLDYQRLSGDSQLELWLESPDENIVFTTSLLMVNNLNTELSLSQDGEYTLYVSLADPREVADAVFTLAITPTK